MSSPPGESYKLPPGRYAPDDLLPLLEQPELAGPTISEHDINLVLPSITFLGRAALAKDDLPAYEFWTDHATTFVDTIQLRELAYEPMRFYNEITTLHFFGAIHGHAAAADRLHLMLAGPNGTKAMDTLMELCGRRGINPAAWIERHTTTADGHARAWGIYIGSKRMGLHNEGRAATPEELREPGAGQFVQNAIAGELSAATMISWGLAAYRLTDDPFEKQQLISRYGLDISNLAASQEGVGYHSVAMLAFVTNVNADPVIGHETKVDLSRQAEPEGPPSSASTIEYLGPFELSRAIADGADVADILPLIEKNSLGAYETYTRSSNRDFLMRTASELYTVNGQYERAAAIMARVTSTNDWRYAVEYYARSSGDLSLVRQADELRQIFDDAPVSAAPSYRPPAWRAREQIAAFLANANPYKPNFAEARAAILQMAEDMGQNHPQALAYTHFHQYLARLLGANPESVVIGPKIVEHLDTARNSSLFGTYELLTEHGSPDWIQAGWEHVQANRFSAPTYLMEYARMALAASGASGQH